MKKHLLILVSCCLYLMLVGISNSYAATVDWKGITWNNNYNANTTFTVNSQDYLEVNSSGPADYDAAHYNTSTSFRGSPTPWVEVSFIDSLTSQTQLWLEDESTSGAWTQFGAWNSKANYNIYWWDYDTGNEGWIDTGISRSSGLHTMVLGMTADGVIHYEFDGVSVYSGNLITPNYFGDIYLAGRYDTATFTDYSTGTDFSPAPVPAPATILLFASSLGGLAAFSRRFRKS